MPAGYKEILSFISNIFMANGKKVDSEQRLQLWVREIQSTNAELADLSNAEVYIIRNDIPLVCNAVRKAINEIKVKPYQIIYTPKVKCPYCNGLNWVYATAYFGKDGKFININYALKCYHNDSDTINALRMDENKDNNKTLCKDGYFKIFTDVCERDSYLAKVYANGGFDFR